MDEHDIDVRRVVELPSADFAHADDGEPLHVFERSLETCRGDRGQPRPNLDDIADTGKVAESDLQGLSSLESPQPVEARLGLSPPQRGRCLPHELFRCFGMPRPPRVRDHRQLFRHMGEHVAEEAATAEHVRQELDPWRVVSQRAQRVHPSLQCLAETEEGE